MMQAVRDNVQCSRCGCISLPDATRCPKCGASYNVNGVKAAIGVINYVFKPDNRGRRYYSSAGILSSHVQPSYRNSNQSHSDWFSYQVSLL